MENKVYLGLAYCSPTYFHYSCANTTFSDTKIAYNYMDFSTGKIGKRSKPVIQFSGTPLIANLYYDLRL